MQLLSCASIVIWTATLVLRMSFVAAKLYVTTDVITFRRGVFTVPRYAPVKVVDPLQVGRNYHTDYIVKCNSTTNVDVGATIQFVGNGSQSLLNSIINPSSGGVTTNIVAFTKSTTVDMLISVYQIGGFVNVSANANAVGTISIFGTFNITFVCFSTTPVNIYFDKIIETFPLKGLGNFGYTPSVGQGFNFLQNSKLDDGTNVCCACRKCCRKGKGCLTFCEARTTGCPKRRFNDTSVGFNDTSNDELLWNSTQRFLR